MDKIFNTCNKFLILKASFPEQVFLPIIFNPWEILFSVYVYNIKYICIWTDAYIYIHICNIHLHWPRPVHNNLRNKSLSCKKVHRKKHRVYTVLCHLVKCSMVNFWLAPTNLAIPHKTKRKDAETERPKVGDNLIWFLSSGRLRQQYLMNGRDVLPSFLDQIKWISFQVLYAKLSWYLTAEVQKKKSK